MKIKRLFVLFSVLMISFFILSACNTQETKESTQPVKVSSEANNVHPEDMGNQDCLECHVDVTPDIVDQWKHSAHGFISVKCQVCHGDQSNFQRIPSDETCRGCHSHEFNNRNTKAETHCATCHTAHNFNVHNVKQYGK